jgi:hypothetical protein
MTYTATYSPEDNKLRLYSSTRLDRELYAHVRGRGFHLCAETGAFRCADVDTFAYFSEEVSQGLVTLSWQSVRTGCLRAFIRHIGAARWGADECVLTVRHSP